MASETFINRHPLFSLRKNAPKDLLFPVEKPRYIRAYLPRFKGSRFISSLASTRSAADLVTNPNLHLRTNTGSFLSKMPDVKWICHFAFTPSD